MNLESEGVELALVLIDEHFVVELLAVAVVVVVALVLVLDLKKKVVAESVVAELLLIILF